jgi:hypothetical protein
MGWFGAGKRSHPDPVSKRSGARKKICFQRGH